MKTKQSLLLTILCGVFFLSIQACGTLFDIRPELVRDDYNNSPSHCSSIQNNKDFFVKAGKWKTDYKYKFTGIDHYGSVNSKKYTETHKLDALDMHYAASDGYWVITLFSDDPTPDPEYFNLIKEQRIRAEEME